MLTIGHGLGESENGDTYFHAFLLRTLFYFLAAYTFFPRFVEVKLKNIDVVQSANA